MLPIISSKCASLYPHKLLNGPQKAALITDVVIFILLAAVGILVLLTAKGISIHGLNAMSKLGIRGGIAFAVGAGALLMIDLLSFTVLGMNRYKQKLLYEATASRNLLK